MDANLLFWNATVEDLKKGYIYDKKISSYICLICGTTYESGIIYEHNKTLLTAEKRIQVHIHDDHGGLFHYLINLNKKFTGLTDNQKEVLTCIYNDLNDQEIARHLKLSNSTIRNYRFKLREKEKQAKIFTVLMELLRSNSTTDNNSFVELHKTATMIDERYNISIKERENVLSRYIDDNGKLINFPAKEKRKIIILTEISKKFQQGRTYNEKEINEILKPIYDDYVLIRRYLIEYGFLDRSNDCSKYWVK